MAKVRTVQFVLIGLSLYGGAGCRSMNRIFHHPREIRGEALRRTVRLARYAEPQIRSTVSSTQRASRRPTTRPTTQPTSQPAYTVPSQWAQRLPFFMMPLVFGAVAVPTSVKEASESSLTVLPPLAGRAGLSAPPPAFASVVVSRPGLQEGAATGLNFASAVNNLFTPRFNPLSGPTGRCHELAGAGFFRGRRSVCEQHFQR